MLRSRHFKPVFAWLEIKNNVNKVSIKFLTSKLEDRLKNFSRFWLQFEIFDVSMPGQFSQIMIKVLLDVSKNYYSLKSYRFWQKYGISLNEYLVGWGQIPTVFIRSRSSCYLTFRVNPNLISEKKFDFWIKSKNAKISL